MVPIVEKPVLTSESRSGISEAVILTEQFAGPLSGVAKYSRSAYHFHCAGLGSRWGIA